jgi:Zn-finger nucleic acid-binding protein
MECPKCDSAMEQVAFNTVTVDRCTQCKGIWFDGVEHKELKKMKGAETIDTGSEKVGKEYNEMENVACPKCGEAMATVPDKFQPHIRYEVCNSGHGAYFDAGEFKDFKEEGFMDFIKSLSLLRKKK